MESGLWEMVCEVWESGCVGDGWWKMLRGMCEKSSTHYKKAPCSLSVVKYPRFIAKMYILAYLKTKKHQKKSP